MKKILFTFLFTFNYVINGFANWTPCSQVTGMGTYSIDTIGSKIYCGVYMGGVFKSSNNGVNWTNICNGQLPTLVFNITHNNNYLFAFVNQIGIYRTSNNGINWTLLNTNFSPTKGLIANTQSIYSCGIDGVYHSINDGNNWTKTQDTIFNIYTPYLLSFIGQYLMAARSDGIFLTTNDGQKWNKIENSLETSGFNHNTFGGFMSLKIGLCSIGDGIVKFKNFMYWPVK